MAVHSNTLTSLIPDIIEARDSVSRELTGLIPSVTIYSGSEGIAKDETVRIPQTSAMAAEAITPASIVPDTGAQSIGNTTMKMDQAYAVPFGWQGEEQTSFVRGGTFSSLFANQVSQALRTLNNQIESDIAEQYYKASRAWGTPGTTPFGSSIEDAAQMQKILDDNGAPAGDRSLVIDTAAAVKLRSLSNISAAYAAGTDQTLRQGTLLPLFNFDIKQSAQIQAHTKGTGTGYVIVAAGENAGQTTLSLDGGNAGTILSGDVVRFGTGGGSGTGTDYDTNYVITDPSTATGNAAGNIIIGAPGLRVARVNDDVMTIQNSYRANMAFHRSAIVLMCRPPKRPMGGDLAVDVATITDPLTGMTYSIAQYNTYMGKRYQVELVWGVSVVKPEWLALLQG